MKKFLAMFLILFCFSSLKSQDNYHYVSLKDHTTIPVSNTVEDSIAFYNGNVPTNFNVITNMVKTDKESPVGWQESFTNASVSFDNGTFVYTNFQGKQCYYRNVNIMPDKQGTLIVRQNDIWIAKVNIANNYFMLHQGEGMTAWWDIYYYNAQID